MSDAARILLIEDDAAIRKFLRASLTSQGYQYEEAVTGEAGLRMAAYQPPDIILLDLGLPDVDGLEVINRLREWASLPILVLTARDQEQTKIIALDAGADDYVTKPFNMGELLARVRTALRHAQAAGEDASRQSIMIGDLRADLAARQVFKSDSELQLTPIEYRLLTILMRHAGKVLTHGYLLKELWGPGYTDQVHTLRVHAANLRRKIEYNPAQPEYLLTEQGVGYRFREQ